MKPTVLTRVLIAAIAGLASANLAVAATCNVPSGTHPDIQTAVDDIGCAPIVIAAGTFIESPVIDRSVNLTGAGSGQTFIQGQIQVTAGTVHLDGMYIAAAGEALWSHSGAEVSGFDLVVTSGAVSTVIFTDGFESGGTDAWSSVSP
jgi:hypothetical protein